MRLLADFSQDSKSRFATNGKEIRIILKDAEIGSRSERNSERKFNILAILTGIIVNKGPVEFG